LDIDADRYSVKFAFRCPKMTAARMVCVSLRLTLSVPHFYTFFWLWQKSLPKRSAPYWSNPIF